MTRVRSGISAIALVAVACGGSRAPADPPAAIDGPRLQWGLVLHGGAGTITRESMTPERERAYRDVMTQALRAGHARLQAGGSSLDAVVAAITIMEDSPLFNAGRGAVFTAEGTNSLDASIMEGSTLRAGAVAGVGRVRNPIALARLVMERSPHVMLSGAGAEEFAQLQGIELVDPSYFYTESRWRSLERVQEQERRARENADTTSALTVDEKFGTVGVVALDRNGVIAAGTSTGGMTNKRWGRIGDSPIIGAGTYAGPSCGISATGWGEYFIRNVVAYDVCARMEYRDVSLREAAHQVIMVRLESQEPETGGIIGLDGEGNVVAVFNTSGMYHGWIDQDGSVGIGIYAE
ncbi:MAG TPA: isoaspartyl peptidase/L-asparaginase [Longimicrobiales bacterium]|nr:isoaspartyl peptidase/L-asparaginase [Longimicrobiales bacterium]